MDSKVSPLKDRYSAYHQRKIPPEDTYLTHTGPGTPGGEYLRRFWQPIAFTDELGNLPLKVTIMGEELVLFRDLSERIGLLQAHCSHRGSSLEFGRISKRGIRCCYHGWLYDIDGTVLETPGEPPGSTFKDRIYHGAYPTYEYSGLIFAYMGPPEKRPAFPVYDTFVLPGYRLIPGRKHVLPCNWVQVKENCMDPLHIVFLHSMVSGVQFTESHGLLPVLEYRETTIGTTTTQARRVDDNVWVRNSEFIFPNIHQFGPTWENGKQIKVSRRPMHIIWTVPIDDTHTMNISVMPIHENEEGNDTAWLDSVRESFGQLGARPYNERQRVPGDYDAQVSQRPIAIHALEHLGTSDRGVIMFRKLLRKHMQLVQNGEDPKGIARMPGQIIPTLHCDVVLRAPAASTPEADRRLLQEITEKAAVGYYLDNQHEVLVGTTLISG